MITLRGNLTYIDARFTEGPFAGNQVPMVSPWTGSTGLSWNIFGPQLWLDANLRYFSQRYLDGNQNNVNAVYFVPTTTLVDLKIGGEIEKFFWSARGSKRVRPSSSTITVSISSSPGFPFYSFYPQPGRTFMVKTGTNW